MKENAAEQEKILEKLKSEISSLRKTISEYSVEITRLNGIAIDQSKEKQSRLKRARELEEEKAALGKEQAELKRRSGNLNKPKNR